MYPDTDLPPLEITAEQIVKLSNDIPEPIWEMQDRHRKIGVPEQLLTIIAASQKSTLFDMVVEKYNVPVSWVCRLIFEKTVYWRRKNLAVDQITDSVWHAFFKTFKTNPAILENSDNLFMEFLKTPDLTIDTIIKRYSPPKLQAADLEGIVESSLIEEALTIEDSEKRIRFLMGVVMDKCRGHIPAVKVLKKVQEFVQNQKEL